MNTDVIEDTDTCPACGEDLTIDRRTGVDSMYKTRKAEHIRQHIKDEHPNYYRVGMIVGTVVLKIKRLLP